MRQLLIDYNMFPFRTRVMGIVLSYEKYFHFGKASHPERQKTHLG